MTAFAKRQPLVSVIVCVYNARPFLRASIESALSQREANIEILVVDDGSDDGSLETISDLSDARVRRFRQENQGKSAAMNFAISQARGEFYAIQDADDLSEPTRIAQQVQKLIDEPKLAAVFCGHSLILNDRKTAPLAKEKNAARCAHDISHLRMPAHDPTAMYRMSMIHGFAYEPALRTGEGFDYILRVGEQFPMHVLGESLYAYRVHRRSLTHSNIARRDEMTRMVVQRACSRRGLSFEKVWAEQFAARTKGDRDNNLASHFIESVCELRNRSSRLNAIITGLRCAALRPVNPQYHKALIYSIAPMQLVRKIRARNNREPQPA